MLAARTHLLLTTREAAAALREDDPGVRRLLAERDELAARVDALRNVRSAMDEQTYLAELEALLLQVAEITEEIARLRERSR